MLRKQILLLGNKNMFLPQLRVKNILLPGHKFGGRNICFPVKAGVHVNAVLTSLNTAFLSISRSRFKRH